MKKTLFIMLSLLSATSFAQVTDADVEHDMQALANRNPTIAQSVINDQWRLYNKPPQEVNTGKIETMRVEGAQALSKWSTSYAQCHSGYKLTGGGYLLTTFEGGHGYNAPNGSFADIPNNRWVVSRGGMPENRGFKAYAVCMKK